MAMLKPIVGEEAADLRKAMVPIADLKPGDRVMWKGEGFKINASPAIGEVIEVFQVFPIGSHNHENDGTCYGAVRYDFSTLYRDSDGDIVEYMHESVRFDRVE